MLLRILALETVLYIEFSSYSKLHFVITVIATVPIPSVPKSTVMHMKD